MKYGNELTYDEDGNLVITREKLGELFKKIKPEWQAHVADVSDFLLCSDMENKTNLARQDRLPYLVNIIDALYVLDDHVRDTIIYYEKAKRAIK